MPRLDTDETIQSGIGSGYVFSGARIERLGATEYTLVTIAVDETGSVDRFAPLLRDMLLAVVESCRTSPRSENLMIRVMAFSSRHQGGIREIHDFKLLSEITPKDYPEFQPGGLTTLSDASYKGVSHMVRGAKDLSEQDFGVNGITFVITDGYDNASTTSPSMIKETMSAAVEREEIESLISLLIGINAEKYRGYLDAFKKDAGFDDYLDAGDATPEAIARISGFVSRSISSQAQALGTGGPSKAIETTI